MGPFLPRLGLALLLALRMEAAEDLPTRAPGERPGPEHGLMLEDAPELTLPQPADGSEAADAVTEAGLGRAQAQLERARAQQQRWQKLARAGVLSAVEAESTALTVARALVKYQAALAAQTAERLARLRALRDPASSAAELAAAEAAQRSAVALAAEATAALQRQQRLAAEAHLDRQRRLFALGVTTRAQLQRAQAAVEKLPAKAAAK